MLDKDELESTIRELAQEFDLVFIRAENCGTHIRITLSSNFKNGSLAFNFESFKQFYDKLFNLKFSCFRERVSTGDGGTAMLITFNFFDFEEWDDKHHLLYDLFYDIRYKKECKDIYTDDFGN